jgi:hypothetical protein
LGAKDVRDWVEASWGKMLGYVPETFIFLKGWYCFTFKSNADAERVLQQYWVVNSGSLMLKKWHLDFNLDKEIVRHRRLWVLLPGFPLDLWSSETFKLFDNSIGKFI